MEGDLKSLAQLPILKTVLLRRVQPSLVGDVASLLRGSTSRSSRTSGNPMLECLDVHGCTALSCSSLAALKGCTQLLHLDLSSCGSKFLQGPKLESFGAAPSLRTLILADSPELEGPIEQLATAPHLTRLNCCACHNLIGDIDSLAPLQHLEVKPTEN